MQFLERQEQISGREGAYPSHLATYLLAEREVEQCLTDRRNVVQSLIAAWPDYFERLRRLAESRGVHFRAVEVKMDDWQLARNRAVSAETLKTLLGQWSERKAFERSARRPGSDEGAFVKAYPNWKDRTYRDFTAGRWERWVLDRGRYPLPGDLPADRVRRFAAAQLSAAAMAAALKEWLA